jgi:c-di-GMP-binding flagellar brake protein YcgR
MSPSTFGPFSLPERQYPRTHKNTTSAPLSIHFPCRKLGESEALRFGLKKEDAVEFLAKYTERRSSTRFPIERAVRFKVLTRKSDDEPGRGQSVNMSSTGVLFTTDRELPLGKRVELSISWPAQLNDTCALKLVATGRVVRMESGTAAIEIQQYEFRTLGTAGFPA